MVALFLDDCPRHLSDIREAIASGDGQGMEQAAHALRGSVGIFGGEDVLGAVQKLEAMGRADDLTRGEEAYADLEIEIDRLKAALSAPVKRGA